MIELAKKALKRLEQSAYEENKELRENTNEAKDYFAKEMEKIFGDDYLYKITTQTGLGYSATCDFANIAKNYKRTSVTFDNSPGMARFIMHLSTYRSDFELGEKVSWEMLTEHSLRKNGIVFRKITANTPLEATKKLVAWFKKNKDLFDKLPRTNT